jgi:AcrR family transcriptional regulator
MSSRASAPTGRVKSDQADRRVRRTKKLLRDALVSLVLQRGWDAVSVKEVCEHADVGRSTFYAHFVDKEDLLLSGFDDLHRSLLEQRSTRSTPLAFAEALVAHARENVRLYRALLGRKSGQAVQRRFRDTVARVIELEFEELGVPAGERPMATQFVSGGFTEMLLAWLDHPARMESAALAAAFRSLALGAVSASRRAR